MMIIGSRGFIGSHFARAFPEAVCLNRPQFDLCSPHLPENLGACRYAFIAGAAKPKKCEEDPDESYRCNVSGPLSLGKELLKRGILPIFFSTDYVFNDELKVAPLNAYGKQKAELETEGVKLGALVVRLSKVYGIEKGDNTLFDEMASQLKNGKEIRAARDQVFAPVFVGDVIEQTLKYLQNGVKGIVDVTGPRYASRLEMAMKMTEKMGACKDLIQEISLDDLNDGVRRPKFLRFTSSFPAMDWEQGIEHVVAHYAEK